MKSRALYSIQVLLVIGLVFSSQSLFAQGIKERMKQRLPVIVELKKKGIIGENNRGYLEFISDKKIRADVIAAENSDREKIYSRIASQQGASLELVEKLRAKQLVENAEPGDYLQKSDGSWYKK